MKNDTNCCDENTVDVGACKKPMGQDDSYIEWQKRFILDGEHNTQAHLFTCGGEVLVDYTNKQYYWQEDKVYDLIGPFVKRLINDGFDCLKLWGKGGVADRLIPYQQRYNKIENQIEELTHRLTCGILCVEDGSVDIDEISEEGLAPGKIIVYRQGGKCPTMLCNEETSVLLLKQLCEMRDFYKKELLALMGEIENESFWDNHHKSDNECRE